MATTQTNTTNKKTTTKTSKPKDTQWMLDRIDALRTKVAQKEKSAEDAKRKLATRAKIILGGFHITNLRNNPMGEASHKAMLENLYASLKKGEKKVVNESDQASYDLIVKMLNNKKIDLETGEEPPVVKPVKKIKRTTYTILESDTPKLDDLIKLLDGTKPPTPYALRKNGKIISKHNFPSKDDDEDKKEGVEAKQTEAKQAEGKQKEGKENPLGGMSGGTTPAKK